MSYSTRGVEPEDVSGRGWFPIMITQFMRFTNEDLKRFGYVYDPNTCTAIRQHQERKQAERPSLELPSRAPGKGKGKRRAMVLQKHRVRICLEAYAVRPIDPPNTPEAAKYIIDALVDQGLLEDDSWRHCEVVARCFKVGKTHEERLEVTLQIIENKNPQPDGVSGGGQSLIYPSD